MRDRLKKKRVSSLLTIEKKALSIEQKHLSVLTGLSGSGISSIEGAKRELIGRLLVDNSLTFESLSNLQEINVLLLKIINAEQNKKSVKFAVQKRKIKFTKAELSSTVLANKILKGLSLAFPSDSDPTIRTFLEEGGAGISILKKHLADIEGLDIEGLEKLGLIFNELNELKKTIHAQSRVIRRAKRKYSGSVLESLLSYFDRSSETDLILQLSALTKKEFETHNTILRKAYRELPVIDEKNKLASVIWLEKRAIALSEDLLLILNKYEIPKIKFPSRNFALYNCSVSNALYIVNEVAITRGSTFPSQRNFILGGIVFGLECLPFALNRVSRRFVEKDNEVGFMFPLENLMRHHFFVIDFSKKDFFICSASESDISMLKQYIKDFDYLLSNTESSYNRWVKEMAELERKFRKKFGKKGISLIQKGFVKRWVKEALPDFRVKGHRAYDIMLSIFDEEELLRMNLQEFKSAIAKTKKLCQEALFVEEELSKKSLNRVYIGKSLFLAPESKVLFWERNFKKLQNRPNVFYYQGRDIYEGATEALNFYTRGKKIKKLPKVKTFGIIDVDSRKPLSKNQYLYKLSATFPV